MRFVLALCLYPVQELQSGDEDVIPSLAKALPTTTKKIGNVQLSEATAYAIPKEKTLNAVFLGTTNTLLVAMIPMLFRVKSSQVPIPIIPIPMSNPVSGKYRVTIEPDTAVRNPKMPKTTIKPQLVIPATTIDLPSRWARGRVI